MRQDQQVAGDGDRQSRYVAQIFNEMAGEYDNLKDPWYSYTFSEIERVLRRDFRPQPSGPHVPVAIDVGCGTGLQSLVLAEIGYQVEGIDIADELLTIARSKLAAAGFVTARFQHADATSLPFSAGIAEVVNCCGPTLSFVPEWRAALREMARCLRPGGRLLLEVEGKWTFDLGWEVINACIGNRLGYDKSLKDALKQLLPPWSVGPVTTYSFALESGESVRMPLKLFTARELSRELADAGMLVERQWGLHGITNIIPSTVLHRSDASPFIRALFRRLAWIERRISGVWPFKSLACSLLVIAQKKDGE